MNSTSQKNELIFDYSSGNLGDAKSFFVSMYLYLNTVAAKKYSIFENLLANNLFEIEDISPKNIKYTDCIKKTSSIKLEKNSYEKTNPLSNLLGDFKQINWKSIYKGFKE